MDRCAAIVTIGFALIFLQIISCHAAVTGTATNAGQDPAEDSVSSGADGPFPCSYKGKILLTGEDLVLEDCITCTCDNSTLHCSIPNCPLIACSDGQEPVKLKDDCCESCPDPSTQYDVASPHHQSGCVVSFDKESTHFSVGEVYEYNDCISCTCQAHHDAKCVLRACPNSPSVSCYNPVKIKGECCEVCPYDLPVWKVQISEPPVITAGERNEVEIGLVIHLNGWVGRKGAVGEDLIKVSAWADDGRGNRVGYIDQVLTAEQASREIVHRSATYTDFNHTINGIGFVFDASGAICSQMENLCVEISKGDNPSVPDPMLPYTVRGVAGERNGTEVPGNLVSCIPFQGCQDSTSGGESSEYLSPCSYRRIILLHGDSLVVDECTVCTCDDSTVVCTLQNCPVIACSDGQEPVRMNDDCCESCPDPSTQYEVASPHNQEGCTVKGIHLSVGGVHELDDCTSCICQAHHDIKCEIRACYWEDPCDNRVKLEGECCTLCPYDLPVWKVQISEPPAITAGERNEVEIGLVIHMRSISGRGVAGDDLIKVSAWADDGHGNRVGYIDQVLTAEQAGGDIIHRSSNYYGFHHTLNGIEFVFDASDATCSQMENLCVEISKGDNPSVSDPRLPYTVRGVAGERNGTEAPSNLVSCIPFQGCQDAVTRKKISFSVAKKSGQIAFNPSAVLGWSDVFNNVGGAFDTASGVFSSTVTGSYFFTYQITETDHAQSLPQIRLMKNEEVIITGNSNSNSIIVDLELGDTVWLQLQGELVGTDDIYTSFTGFLI